MQASLAVRLVSDCRRLFVQICLPKTGVRILIHSLLIVFVLAATSIACDDPVDSIKRKLTKAEEAHRLELAKAQVDVIKWLDSRDASARKKGDKATVNLVKLQREKLETLGTIPNPIPVNMSRKVDTARDLLDASYASLLKEALIAKLDDLADEIEDKRVQLIKEKPDTNVFKIVAHMAKNMVQNGSFEFPEVPNGVDHVPLQGNGWDNLKTDIVKFKGAVPVHGEQMLQFMKADVTQSIAGFVPGERYVLTAYVGTYASPQHPNPSMEVSITIAGEKELKTVKATNAGVKGGYVMTGTDKAKWEKVTLIFKALGETHELKISELSQNGNVVTLDQVSILPYLGN